jgi:hypothetical protein
MLDVFTSTLEEPNLKKIELTIDSSGHPKCNKYQLFTFTRYASLVFDHSCPWLQLGMIDAHLRIFNSTSKLVKVRFFVFETKNQSRTLHDGLIKTKNLTLTSFEALLEIPKGAFLSFTIALRSSLKWGSSFLWGESQHFEATKRRTSPLASFELNWEFYAKGDQRNQLKIIKVYLWEFPVVSRRWK